MSKKCMICDEPAQYCIKGKPSDCYCQDCAVEQFGDVTYLVKVEETARQLKEAIDQLSEEGISPQSDAGEPIDQLAEEGIEDNRDD